MLLCSKIRWREFRLYWLTNMLKYCTVFFQTLCEDFFTVLCEYGPCFLARIVSKMGYGGKEDSGMSRARISNLWCRIAIVLVVCCLMTAGLSVNTALALPGSGTQQNPWQIQSLDDFNDFAAFLDDTLNIKSWIPEISPFSKYFCFEFVILSWLKLKNYFLFSTICPNPIEFNLPIPA